MQLFNQSYAPETHNLVTKSDFCPIRGLHYIEIFYERKWIQALTPVFLNRQRFVLDRNHISENIIGYWGESISNNYDVITLPEFKAIFRIYNPDENGYQRTEISWGDARYVKTEYSEVSKFYLNDFRGDLLKKYYFDVVKAYRELFEIPIWFMPRYEIFDFNTYESKEDVMVNTGTNTAVQVAATTAGTSCFSTPDTFSPINYGNVLIPDGPTGELYFDSVYVGNTNAVTLESWTPCDPFIHGKYQLEGDQKVAFANEDEISFEMRGLGEFYILVNGVRFKLKASEKVIKNKLIADIKRKIRSNIVGPLIKHKERPKFDIVGPEQKAIDTLRDMISERAYRRYLRDGYIFVEGPTTKQLYQIFRDHYQRIRVYKNRKYLGKICIHTIDGVPPTDHVISMKIMIELDEINFLKRGNYYEEKKILGLDQIRRPQQLSNVPDQNTIFELADYYRQQHVALLGAN